MNENEPNDRLKQGPAHVARLLDSAAADEATDAELAELDRRVGVFAAAPAPHAPKGFSAGGAGWVGAGLATVILAAGVWWAASRSTPEPVALSPPPSLPAPAPSEQPASPAELEPPPPPAPPARPPVKEPPPRPPAPSAAPAASPDPADELVLLERADTALRAGKYAEALERVAEHEQQFESGTFVQEREVLAVQALLLQGNRVEAEQRAERFFARYGGSVHVQRVRALLRDAGS